MNYSELNLQRKIQIENGLLELMQEIPYEAITVKDLTEALHFARKTFYHYFPSKRACLESLTDRLIYTCNLKELQGLPENPTPEEVYTSRLNFWIAHRAFLEAINRNNLGSFLLERFLIYLSKEDKTIQNKLNAPQVKCDEDILFFYMSGQLFLLLKWCNDGFRLSVEEMVQKKLRLIHQPLLPPEMEG